MRLISSEYKYLVLLLFCPKGIMFWEGTGKCTMRAAGVGVLARRERFVEITSGRSYFQQRLTATCKDLMFEVDSVGIRRI